MAADKKALAGWWKQIEKWRARKSLAYESSKDIIKPQYAIQRLYELTKDRDVYITTEVGQHQMWAAQFFKFEEPNRWMTSGGLGTMGYGLPAAVGVQLAHPDALVIDIAGEASVQMTMQEMSTAVQYDLPIKIFILNNQYMGMVRQWQELLHGGRYAHSYSEALPDFVKLAEAYHAVGIRCEKPGELDAAIKEMIKVKKPVIFDCVVDPNENCFPMIPSGRAHNEMLLGDAAEKHRGGDHRGRQGDGVSDFIARLATSLSPASLQFDLAAAAGGAGRAPVFDRHLPAPAPDQHRDAAEPSRQRHHRVAEPHDRRAGRDRVLSARQHSTVPAAAVCREARRVPGASCRPRSTRGGSISRASRSMSSRRKSRSHTTTIATSSTSWCGSTT